MIYTKRLLQDVLAVAVTFFTFVSAVVAEPATPDARLFAEHVTLLASPEFEGRAPGTVGLDKARDWVIDAFQGIGLEPAFDGRFTQPFETSIGIVPRAQALAINGEALAPEGDFNVLGFSASKAFNADVVFVGYGISDPGRHYDNYANLDVKGKVVIAYRYEPQNDKGISKWTKRANNWTPASHLTTKAKWAADHGAAALLLVTPPAQRLGGDSLRSTRQTVGSKVGDLAVFHISGAAFGRILTATTRNADLAQTAFQRDADADDNVGVELKGVRIAGNVKLERDNATVANVAALLPGRGSLAGELLVIGAHYDHLGFGNAGSLAGTTDLHPGADDNASGTAALVAIAERLARDDGTSPRRTILFAAFTAEERGLIGSAHMLKHFADTGFSTDAVCAMLNLDMVGRLSNDKLLILGLGSGQGWSSPIKQAARDAGLTPVTQERAHGSSDHATFYRYQVPAIHFFTGVHKDYHRPGDTADKVNADGAVKVIAAVTAIARTLATQEQRIAFDADGARESGQMHSAFGGAFLGIVPDYATLDGDDGCGVTGISPGSPAEDAGVQPDDVITAWNGRKIANVYDLTKELGKANPDEKVKLTLTRAAKTMTLEVTLGRR